MLRRAFWCATALGSLLGCSTHTQPPPSIKATVVDTSTGAVRVVDVGDGSVKTKAAQPTAVPSSVRFSADGTSLLLAGPHGVASLDAATLAMRASRPRAASVAIGTSDGRELVIASGNTLRFTTEGALDAGRELTVDPPASNAAPVTNAEIQALVSTPDGRRLLVGQSGGRLGVVDVASHQVVGVVALCAAEGQCSPARRVAGVVSTRDSRTSYVLTVEDSTLWSVDLPTLTVRAGVNVPSGAVDLAITPDGATVVAVTSNALVLIDSDSGTVRTSVTGRAPFGPGVSFSQDGATALVASATSGLVSAIDLDSRAVSAATSFGSAAQIVAAPAAPKPVPVQLCSHASELTSDEIRTMERTCTQCHSLERIVTRRQSLALWSATIDQMESLGLQMDAPTRKTVESYLGKALCTD